MPVTWTIPHGITDALRRVCDGATPVGGGAALMSVAFPHAFGLDAVDLSGLLPSGVQDGVLGGGTTLADVATDPVVRRRWPAVADAAAVTGNPQIRNVATVGGTIAARIPTADLPAALMAHDAVVAVALPDTAEPIWVELQAYLARPPGPHLVLGVCCTRTGAGTYRRFARRAGPAPAVAGVAVVRTRHDVQCVAAAVSPDGLPLPFMPGAVPPASALRTDDRASALLRHRVLRALTADALDALDAA